MSRKKIIIISVISLFVIAIIVVDVILYLNYRGQQKQAEKIASDIQQVEQLIQAGRFDQLNPEELQQAGFTQDAVTIAKQAIIEEEARKSAEEELKNEQARTVEERAFELYRNFDIISPDNQQVINSLLELGDELVSKLDETTTGPIISVRYDSYTILNILAYNSQTKRETIIPIIKKGLDDPYPAIRASTASWIAYYGDKDSLPVLISLLDDQYKTIIVRGEPPQYVQQHALSQLLAYTDQNFIYDQTAWQTWWEENKDKLQWSDTIHKFK